MSKLFPIPTLALFFCLALGCAHTSPPPPPAEPTAADRLNAVIEEYTAASKKHDPFYAPYFNVEEDLDKFGDYPAPEYYARLKRIIATALENLKEVQPQELTEKDRRTLRLFKDDLEISLKSFDFPSELLRVTQMDSRLHEFMDDSSKELTSFPFNSVKHYRDFAKRSEGFPLYVDREIELLRRGIREKITLSCIVAKQVPNTYKDALEENVEKNPFWRPMTFMPKDFSENDRRALEGEYRRVIAEKIVPAYKKFDAFFKKEYAPRCRRDYGIGNLPRGKEWYAHAILASTNLKLTAEQVHKTGLHEVERITREMDEVRKKVGYRGGLAGFLKSVKNQAQAFFTRKEDLYAAFSKTKEETSKKIPQYFSLIPKSEYEIVATSNPEDAAGRYSVPTENIPYGRFIVNTINLRAVPTYGVNSLLIHEAVPGHHFQLALQYEMKDQLSEYQRKIYHSNAFVEGWALYAEFLGNEMGLFTDPMQRLGNLNDELLRAVRLVVDSGIHAYGWSKERTVAYMKRYLISDDQDIVNEANRYSVWPGQALGYKIGQLKILELRRLAEKELGPKFDIKEFHRVVIGNGTVSLPVLEEQVRAWISKTRST